MMETAQMQTAITHRRGKDAGGTKSTDTLAAAISPSSGSWWGVPVVAATLDRRVDAFVVVLDVTINVCELTVRDKGTEKRRGNGR